MPLGEFVHLTQALPALSAPARLAAHAGQYIGSGHCVADCNVKRVFIQQPQNSAARVQSAAAKAPAHLIKQLKI